MAEQKLLAPNERMYRFLQSTRQYKQELPAMTFSAGQTISTTFPKTRFLSKVYLRIKGSFVAKHASKTTFTKNPFDMYRLIRQVRLTINNGFNPYQIGGVELSLYNLADMFSALKADPYGTRVIENVVSSAGTTDKVSYTLELPITLSEKDLIGLVNLQNEQTVVTLNVDCGNITDVMSDTDIEIVSYNIAVTPVLETFSIPLDANSVPDYSIIKLVNEEISNVVGAGDMIVKLPTGLTYRRMIVYIASDAKFTPIDTDQISNFQLVFNQADSPYNISADHLAYENTMAYGGNLPKGCFVFDFASQGLSNLGGSRDFIDTERLQEFWLKINFKNLTGNSNYVYVISEKLARML